MNCPTCGYPMEGGRCQFCEQAEEAARMILTTPPTRTATELAEYVASKAYGEGRYFDEKMLEAAAMLRRLSAVEKAAREHLKTKIDAGIDIDDDSIAGLYRALAALEQRT